MLWFIHPLKEGFFFFEGELKRVAII